MRTRPGCATTCARCRARSVRISGPAPLRPAAFAAPMAARGSAGRRGGRGAGRLVVPAVARRSAGSATRGCPSSRRIVDRIQGLEEGRESWDAFVLGRRIEAAAPGDPLFERLRPKFTREITITSDPPGATVLARYYDEPDARAGRARHDAVDGLQFPARVHAGPADAGRPAADLDDVIWNFGLRSAMPWHYAFPAGRRGAGGRGLGARRFLRTLPARPGPPEAGADGRLRDGPSRGDEPRVPAVRRRGRLPRGEVLAAAVRRRRAHARRGRGDGALHRPHRPTGARDLGGRRLSRMATATTRSPA